MSGELKEQSILGQIIWRVLVVLLTIFGLYFILIPIWNVGTVQVGLHTLLAFLAIIGVGVVSFDIRRKNVTWKFILMSVFLFTAIVNFVTAIWHLYPAYYTSELYEITADLIEMMLLGLIILGAMIPTKFTQSEMEVKRGLVFLSLLTFGSLLIYGVLYYFLLPIALFFDPLLPGMGFGVICIAIFIVSFIILARQSKILHRYSAVFFISGLIIMMSSIAGLIISYVIPFSLLAASIMLRAAMMYFFFVSVAIPVQKEIEITEDRAHLFGSLLALLALIPYALTLLLVAFVPITLIFPEQGIYTLTHVIVAFLAAIIVRLLWLFTKQQPHWHRYPLIMAFVSLTIVESIIVFLSPWVEVSGEYTLLYVLAGLLVVFWLYLTLRWIYNTPTRMKHESMIRWIVYISTLMTIIILAGVWLQNYLFLVLPLTIIQLLFRSILLAVCLIGTSFLAYLFIIFIQMSKGKPTMGFIVLGTLALWLIANIIRVNFIDWTAGWWVAQFLVLFGFMLGPSILGRLYLTALEQSERERKRATLYADILIHDLRNYHTVIQTSLDLLMLSQDPTEAVDVVTDNIQTAITRAGQLITNVRSLELASNLQSQDLARIDIVSVIHEAWEHIQDPDEEITQFEINRQPNECFVQANELLLEVFINLFRNALQYSEEVKRIQVDIHPLEQFAQQYWKIRVLDWGKGIPAEQKQKLFKRFTEGAKGLGLGLYVVKSLIEAFGGSVSVENRVPDDESQGTVFIIKLLRLT